MVTIRCMAFLLLAAGSQLPCLASWFEPECEAPLPYTQYVRKHDIWRYDLVTAGPDAGKYKPVYYVRVETPGSCQGRYANPCGILKAAKKTRTQTDPAACKLLRDLASNRTVVEGGLVKPKSREDWMRLPDAEKAKWEPVTVGPEAYQAVYKPVGYVRVSKQGFEGTYYPPNGHWVIDTVIVDPYLSKWLQKLIRDYR
jgi:hypothetical protein